MFLAIVELVLYSVSSEFVAKVEDDSLVKACGVDRSDWTLAENEMFANLSDVFKIQVNFYCGVLFCLGEKICY